VPWWPAWRVANRETRNLHNLTFRPRPVGVLLKETNFQRPPRLAATMVSSLLGGNGRFVFRSELAAVLHVDHAFAVPHQRLWVRLPTTSGLRAGGGWDRALGHRVRRFRSASGHPNVALARSWVLTASTYPGLRSAGIVWYPLPARIA
jgi:hypothetical protein